MNIETMSRAELECAILSDNDLYQYFGGDANIANVIKMSDEEVREKIRQWIIDGDETQPI
jgi:GTP cyclohydrolase III